MVQTDITKAMVTLVVVPRERWSYARESLESIYQHTRHPFELVYIDGRSPRHLRRYLETQAQEKGFHLLRTEYFLTPNGARNLGLNQVQTKYVVFVDNDVVVTPGWLDTLVSCAEQTGAAVVGPLTCQERPLHTIIHCAGGESGISIEHRDGSQMRQVIERIYHQGKQVADMRPGYRRQKTGLAEFHCVLARTDAVQEIGGLDEGLMNTKEHVDFCMSIEQTGGAIYFEPDSLVTYVFAPPLRWTDLPYYMMRWSDRWELNSLYHLRDKWNLSEEGWLSNRIAKVGWRRRFFMIRPFLRHVPIRAVRRLLERLLVLVDKRLNANLTRNDKHHCQRQHQIRETPSHRPAA